MLFSSKLVLTTLAGAFSLMLGIENAQAIPSWNKPCLKAYRDFEKKSGHQAFALTSDGPRGQNCGHTWGAPSKQAAEQGALKQCRVGKWASGRPATSWNRSDK
jgi:hypothetical protein